MVGIGIFVVFSENRDHEKSFSPARKGKAARKRVFVPWGLPKAAISAKSATWPLLHWEPYELFIFHSHTMGSRDTRNQELNWGWG